MTYKAQVPKVTHNPQFDLKTHLRDGKGNIVNENHYNLTIKNHVQEFERPPGSGYIYDASGVLLRSPEGEQAVKTGSGEQIQEVDVKALLKELADLKAKTQAPEKIQIDEPHLEETEEIIPEAKAFVKPGYLKK